MLSVSKVHILDLKNKNRMHNATAHIIQKDQKINDPMIKV